MRRHRLLTAVAIVAIAGGSLLTGNVAHADTSIYGPVPGSRAIMPTGAAADVTANWVNYLKQSGAGLSTCSRQIYFVQQSFTGFTADRDYSLIVIKSDGNAALDASYNVKAGTAMQASGGKTITQVVACAPIGTTGGQHLSPPWFRQPPVVFWPNNPGGNPGNNPGNNSGNNAGNSSGSNSGSNPGNNPNVPAPQGPAPQPQNGAGSSNNSSNSGVLTQGSGTPSSQGTPSSIPTASVAPEYLSSTSPTSSTTGTSNLPKTGGPGFPIGAVALVGGGTMLLIIRRLRRA